MCVCVSVCVSNMHNFVVGDRFFLIVPKLTYLHSLRLFKRLTNSVVYEDLCRRFVYKLEAINLSDVDNIKCTCTFSSSL